MALPFVLAAIAVGANVGRAFTQYDERQQKLKSIDLAAKQQEIVFQQKSLANMDLMKNVLETQVAQATVRGVSLNSPSFNAIQRNTYNTGIKEEKNLNIEKSIFDQNVDIEKTNTKNKFIADIFGDITSSASAGISGYNADNGLSSRISK